MDYGDRFVILPKGLSSEEIRKELLIKGITKCVQVSYNTGVMLEKRLRQNDATGIILDRQTKKIQIIKTGGDEE